MFNGRNGGSAGAARGVVMTIIVLAVILALLGAFDGGLTPANRVSVPGLLAMALGIAAVVAANPIAKGLTGESAGKAARYIKLAGVMVCGVGAIIVICL